jgi:hypothetical protein
MKDQQWATEPVGSTTKNGSQKADDDDGPAEWHAGTTSTTRGTSDGRGETNKKRI